MVVKERIYIRLRMEETFNEVLFLLDQIKDLQEYHVKLFFEVNYNCYLHKKSL